MPMSDPRDRGPVSCCGRCRKIPPWRRMIRCGSARWSALPRSSSNREMRRQHERRSSNPASPPTSAVLSDSPPQFLGAGGTFPQEAMQWGFEGWTQTQFDVSAEGRVVNERAILSYPPFVFTQGGRAHHRGRSLCEILSSGRLAWPRRQQPAGKISDGILGNISEIPALSTFRTAILPFSQLRWR